MEPKETRDSAKLQKNNLKYVTEEVILPIRHNLPLQLPPQREKMTFNKNTSEIIPGNVKIKKENNMESQGTQTFGVKTLSIEEYEYLLELAEWAQKRKNCNEMDVIYVADDDDDLAKAKVNKIKYGQKEYEIMIQKSDKMKKIVRLTDQLHNKEISYNDFTQKFMAVAIFLANLLYKPDENVTTTENGQNVFVGNNNTDTGTYSNINNQTKAQHDLEKLHQNPLQTSKDIPIVPLNNNDIVLAQENLLQKNAMESEPYSNTNYQIKLQPERPKIQQYNNLQNKSTLYDNNNLIAQNNQWTQKDTEIYPNINYQTLPELQKFQHHSMQSSKKAPLNKNDTQVTSDASWMQIPNNTTDTSSNFNHIKVNQGLHHRYQDSQMPNTYPYSNVQHNNTILRAENFAAQKNTYDEQHDTPFMTTPNIHGKDKYKIKTQAQYTSLLNQRNKGHTLNNEFPQQPHPQFLPYNSYVNRQQMYPLQKPPYHQHHTQQHPHQHAQQHLQQYPQQYHQKYQQQQHPQNHQYQQFVHQNFQQPKPQQQQQPQPQQQPFQQQNYFY